MKFRLLVLMLLLSVCCIVSSGRANTVDVLDTTDAHVPIEVLNQLSDKFPDAEVISVYRHYSTDSIAQDTTEPSVISWETSLAISLFASFLLLLLYIKKRARSRN